MSQLKEKSHLDKGTTEWRCEGLGITRKVKSKPSHIKSGIQTTRIGGKVKESNVRMEKWDIPMEMYKVKI